MKFIKKNMKFIVLILTCLLVYAIYNNNDNKNISYVNLGDGFAQGINSYGGKGYGYGDYLKDYLENNNRLYNYYNKFSYDDISINDLYKDILINKKDKDNVNIKQALRDSNLLTLSIGLNDLIYQMSLNPQLTESVQNNILKKIETDMINLVNEIQKYYKYDIYLIGYYNFYPQNSVENKLLTRLNSIYSDIADEYNLKYIDIENITENREYLENPSSFYPNLEGYKKIFEKILEEITL